ncbi:MAG: RAD55 family ATPase [Thermoplasmata archaeon]
MAMESPRPFVLPSAVPRPFRSVEAGDIPARIPTGVPDFDYLSGGLPAGSVVLLFGGAGAGHEEFALTSAVHLMLRYDDPQLHQFYLGSAKGPFVFPDSVVYLSTSRSREQVMSELRGAFDGTYPSVLGRHLTFRDLSPSYFADTVVPTAWSSVTSPLLSGAPASVAPPEGPLQALAEAVEECGDNRLVIIDSLTDLLVRRGVDAADVLTLLKGLRRRAKRWGGLVYLILSEGVAPPAIEQAVIDSVDGVLHFNWVSSPSHSHRQRTMLIDKFMPVLSRLPAEHQGRFVIRVNAKNGLVTTQYERI